MAGKLVVDKAILDEQKNKMRELSQSEDLKNAINNLSGVISSSTGDTASKSNGLLDSFQSLDTNMALLFSRTADFLENKHGDFVEADENLSGS